MPLPRADVERALEQKLQMQRVDSDHRRFYLVFDGRNILHTMTSHGTKYRELGDQLLGLMAKELRVPRKFFVDLVRCTRSRDEYIDQLRQRNLLP